MEIWVLFTTLAYPLLTIGHPNREPETTVHEIPEITQDPAVNPVNVLEDLESAHRSEQTFLKTCINKRIQLEKTLLNNALNEEPINLDLDIGDRWQKKIDKICQEAVDQYEYFTHVCESISAGIYDGNMVNQSPRGRYSLKHGRIILNSSVMKPAEILRRYYATDRNPKIMRAQTDVMYCHVDCALHGQSDRHMVVVMGIIKKQDMTNDTCEVYLLYFPSDPKYFNDTPRGYVVDAVTISTHRDDPPPKGGGRKK